MDSAFRLRPGDALIVVDVQSDFLPGGRLPVPRGDEVVPALNRWLDAFAEVGLPVFASRDWHPPDHCSFREQGGRWPAHCIAGTPGAAFAPGLIREGIALVGVLGTAASTTRAARKVVAAAVKGWAACLGRIFEVDVIKCTRCGGTMKAIASITDDSELERLLRHVGLEADLPKTRPARAPPAAWGGEGSQVDPATDAWDGKDAQPADD